MSTRLSSRVYNPVSLEVWFGNVGLDWELSFSEEALRKGRELYVAGKITGVELAEQDAIVNCKFARKDTCYAVIDWTQDGPIVRFSGEDLELGKAVAVAGLYEIEELIADEITPVAYAAKEASKSMEQDTVDPADMPPEIDERPARRLTPKLKGSRSGLRLTAYWSNCDDSRELAFRSDTQPLISSEREALVRFTGRAKEAGFVFRRETNDFVMHDPERIAPFFSHTCKRWEDAFDYLDLDYEAQIMAEGVREVKIIGRVETAEADTMRVDWRFKLGKQWLDPEDAERLAKAGRGMHIIHGFGLVRIEEEQSAALKEWQVAQASHSEGAQIWPRYMVFSLFAERGAELDLEDELSAWRKATIDVVKDDTVELPNFLRAYQGQGVRWMANLRKQGCHGLLADEMGLGKTLQVLTLLRKYPFEQKHSLIVCPASVVPVWQSEASRWYPNLNTKVLGSGVDFESHQPVQPTLWVASYTQLRRHKHLLDQVEFGYAVLDEAQQIKNPDAKVTQACCAIQAECRLALTGTPIENRMLDIWTLFRFLMPGLLGTRRRFEAMVESEHPKVRQVFEERLRQQIEPFILRRLKDKVGKDLPPKVEMDLVCPITDVQRQLYKQLLAQGKEDLGGDLQAAIQSQSMNFFTLLTRLRQVCCDPGLISGMNTDLLQSGKVQALLARLIEAFEADRSRKIVIFSQFLQLLKRLKPLIEKEFPGIALLELSGETRNRQKPVERFQNEKGPAVILVSLRAGGTGITLHAADYVFLLDPWWNPAVENQAVDRVHRIGQGRRVFVYRMITQGTIEERIQQLKKEKRELFENTLGHLGSAKDLADHFGDLEELAKLLPAEG